MHLLSLRDIRLWLLNGVAVLMLVGGCSAPIYPHDQALEEQLKSAQKSIEEASSSDADAFATMIANSEKAAELRRAAIVRSAEAKTNGDLNAIATMTWAELKANGARAAGNYGDKLQDTDDQIASITKEIARLQQLIESDPGEALANQPPAQPTPELDSVTAALNKIKKSSPTLNKDVSAYLDAIQKYLGIVDEKVFPALEKYASDQKLDQVLAILRKAKDQELIGEVNRAIAGAKDPASIALPKSLSEAIKEYLGRDITNVGELRKLLAAKDTAIEEVRLSLLRDGRQTMVEIRKAQLAELKEKLRLDNLRLLILQQLVVAARHVEAQSPPGGVPSESRVLLTLLDWHKAYHRESTQPATQPGVGAGDDVREHFTNAIGVLAWYTNVNGSLDRWLRITDDEIQTLEHRSLLEQGRIGTEAYRRLASLGLDGMVTFAEDGVTEAEVANWLRALQTVGIGVIGAKVD